MTSLYTLTHDTTLYEGLNMTAVIGTSDQPCRLAEAFKILLHLHAWVPTCNRSLGGAERGCYDGFACTHRHAHICSCQRCKVIDAVPTEYGCVAQTLQQQW